jgi:hypothetical protein
MRIKPLCIAFFSIFLPFKAFAVHPLSPAQQLSFAAWSGGSQLIGCISRDSSLDSYFFYFPASGSRYATYTQLDYPVDTQYYDPDPEEGGTFWLGTFNFYQFAVIRTEQDNASVIALKARPDFSPASGCTATAECQTSLDNPNDMLCEENYHGGNMMIDGKRREY